MRISKGVVKAVSRLERRGWGRGSQVRKRLAGGGRRVEPSVPLANGSPVAPKGNVVAVKRGSLVSVVSLTGDRGFESCSLHQRVWCEPDFQGEFLRSFCHRPSFWPPEYARPDPARCRRFGAARVKEIGLLLGLGQPVCRETVIDALVGRSFSSVECI